MSMTTSAPRPPESWPGAGGLKSMAPEVAPWPGKRTTSDEPGGSWPGAVRSESASPSPRPRDLDDDALRDLKLRLPSERVSPRAVGMWRLTGLLAWLVPLIALVAWVAVDDAHRSWQLGASLLVILAGLLLVGVVPSWRYRVHRWEVGDEAVHTQTGWVVQQRRIAPISRIQTVDSEFGPVEQLFGLGTLTVTTASAAGPLRISGLERRTVRRLVDDLTRITAQERGDAT